MDIRIRKVLPEDASAYADCVISCWQTAYRGIVPDDYLNNMSAEREKWIEKYRNALSNPDDCDYYCAVYGEKMIGFFVMNKGHADNFWAIYLLEEFRGKVYGTKLMDFAINELRRAGDNQVCLWVFEDNSRARRFYEKRGFAFDGTARIVDKYGGVPLAELRYVLNL